MGKFPSSNDGFETFYKMKSKDIKRKSLAIGKQEKKLKKDRVPKESDSDDHSVSDVPMADGPSVSPSGEKNFEKKEESVYPEGHEGDIFVLVDVSQSNDFDKKLTRNGLPLYEKLKKFSFQGFLSIKMIGKTLFRIKFDNISNANTFVKHDFKELKIRAFIPNTYLYSYGVIRGIPTSLSENEIMEGISADVPIAFVQRFKKRFIKENSEIEFIPTFTVKIAFCGNKIPEEVKLNYSIIKVDVFFPSIRQCSDCGRFGHTKNSCRSTKRCLKCASFECNSKICNSVKCILCGGESHYATDKKSCPKWAAEENINKIMTLKKISRSEVINSFQSNRFETLKNYNEDFPAVIEKEKPKIKNLNAEVNNILTQHSYSKVVLRKKSIPSKKPNITLGQAVSVNPTRPAYEYPKYEKVSELERLLGEVLKFTADLCKVNGLVEGSTAIKHFKQRADKTFLNVDREIINNHSNDVQALNS